MWIERLQAVGLLTVELVIVSGVALILLSLRRYFGLAPLYVMLGVTQIVQSLAAATIYFEVLPGVIVSPGSTIFFTTSIFLILVVYILEDALEVRKLVYGLISGNLVAGVFSGLLSIQLQTPLAINFLDAPEILFRQNLRILLVGTAILFLDSLLLIAIYERVRKLSRWVVVRIGLSAIPVLMVDTLLFATGAFWGTDLYQSILISGLLGKTVSGVLLSGVFALYLIGLGPVSKARSETDTVDDFFAFMTFRERYEALQEQSIRDPLTGVHNRGFLDGALAHELKVAFRNSIPLSLMMIDLDHFKSINDRYGHGVGDEVLRTVGRALSETIRESDYVARYGGEEFVVLLPDCEPSDATRVAENIRKSIELIEIRSRGERLDLSASIGVASHPADGKEPHALLEVADRRLYQAKRTGRNRVVASDAV